ncbi:MAG: prolyl oligopeptidase family serine peptidase, partial [Steroidobacteraceae bacterium]
GAASDARRSPGASAGTVLFGESDFVAYPRVSPDGRQLAWIAWSHPDMPWDSTTLHVAAVSESGLAPLQRPARGAATARSRDLAGATRIAGGASESVLEPRWDADGTLYFLSDRTGWWNLYRFRGGRIEPVLTLEADIAGPLWTLGESSYALTGDGRAVVRYTVNARDRLGIVRFDRAAQALQPFDLPFTGLSSLELLTSSSAIVVATSATSEAAVVAIDLATGTHRIVRAPGTLRVDPAYLSIAEPIEYPTYGAHAAAGSQPAAGAHSTAAAHAFFYPPRNPDVEPLPGEKPPLVVRVHGGPTSHARPDLNLATQFWTTRGFAVLDVNYGGSSGYGRAYRERLNGNWGVVDVADVVAGVKHLVASGLVDAARTAIRGGSAGGFTVLAALAFHDVFRAGADYYGVSDLEALTRDTHKFESRYLDRLVAPLPQGKPIYEARAPIRHLEAFHAPLIVFQGAEDAVVPPAQSRAIVAALERKGVPVVYMELEGEQHGFRKAESIVTTLETELAFYGRVFGFAPAGAGGDRRVPAR